ncbi:MAG: 1-(5-phosphoribosyl)-5-[(5-phosphoribosylamino)methylideneamino]imidazole-4-carboxamide isomerase [Desulfatiglandales bacterium]
MGFLVIPAVDIKGGKAVRLSQGLMEKETIYSEDPVTTAKMWEEMGAERLHLIDLDGAITGASSNRDIIKEIIGSLKIPVQVGGGIRERSLAIDYLDSGASYVIIGTAALERPDFLKELVHSFPKRVILSLDARDGMISVRGWTQDSQRTVLEVVRDYEDMDLAALIYTDILRDGMKTRPDFGRAQELLRNTRIPVILAGGIRDIEDIREAIKLREMGLLGVITGRAIYDRTLNFRDAVQICKGGLKC